MFYRHKQLVWQKVAKPITDDTRYFPLNEISLQLVMTSASEEVFEVKKLCYDTQKY